LNSQTIVKSSQGVNPIGTTTRGNSTVAGGNVLSVVEFTLWIALVAVLFA